MVSYGHYTRSKPRVEVLKGFDPLEPTTLRVSAPVAASNAIKSGMAISLWWNATNSRYEWVIGVDVGGGGLAQSLNTPIYIALQDATDHDVVNAGLLTGLSCSGQYEIQTPYFKTGDTYTDGIGLTYDAATGNLKAAVFDGTIPICGIVSQQHALVDVAPYNSGVTRDGNGQVLVLQLITRFLPAND